jgi:hypothetical protein
MIVNSNAVITKIVLNNGVITSLEINGENVPLASSVEIVDEYVDNLSLASLSEGDIVTIPVEGYDGAKSVVLNITE